MSSERMRDFRASFTAIDEGHLFHHRKYTRRTGQTVVIDVLRRGHHDHSSAEYPQYNVDRWLWCFSEVLFHQAFHDALAEFDNVLQLLGHLSHHFRKLAA